MLEQLRTWRPAPGSAVQWALTGHLPGLPGPPTGPSTRANTAWARGDACASATCTAALLAAPPSATSSAATSMPCCTRAGCTRGCPWPTMVSPATPRDTRPHRGVVWGPRVTRDAALGHSMLSPGLHSAPRPVCSVQTPPAQPSLQHSLPSGLPGSCVAVPHGSSAWAPREPL